jgi:hypothetical protein
MEVLNKFHLLCLHHARIIDDFTGFLKKRKKTKGPSSFGFLRLNNPTGCLLFHWSPLLHQQLMTGLSSSGFLSLSSPIEFLKSPWSPPLSPLCSLRLCPRLCLRLCPPLSPLCCLQSCLQFSPQCSHHLQPVITGDNSSGLSLVMTGVISSGSLRGKRRPTSTGSRKLLRPQLCQVLLQVSSHR